MIRFRPLTADDFPTLLNWLQRPHVKLWWDDGVDTIDKVTAHYSADPETTKRFVLVLDGVDRGYFQFYRFESRHLGVDLFLANADQLSQGIGTRCLGAFIEMITAQEDPKTISIDPAPRNTRAIRCNEKCGFVHATSRSSAKVYFMTKVC